MNEEENLLEKALEPIVVVALSLASIAIIMVLFLDDLLEKKHD